MKKNYNRAKEKGQVAQELKEYLHKTYGDCLIGSDNIELTPYCSNWVKDIVNVKNRLEKIVK
tara:strand:+ start:213 stop:398 length:186 start_codon:yes stop_codon:yes gene_type:complete